MMASGIRRIMNEFTEHDSKQEWKQVENWDLVSEKHQKTLMDAFPQPADLAKMLTDGHAEEWDFEFRIDNLLFICDWQGPITEMKRHFYFNDGFLKLESFEIDSEERGLMHGRKILISTICACLNLGITEMQIEASNIGSYVWARAGFVPDDKSWSKICATVGARLKNDFIFQDIPAEIKNRLLKLINDDDPKNIWKIADDRTLIYRKYLISKELLKLVYWEGIMDLNDSECVDRVREYCRPK